MKTTVTWSSWACDKECVTCECEIGAFEHAMKHRLDGSLALESDKWAVSAPRHLVAVTRGEATRTIFLLPPCIKLYQTIFYEARPGRPYIFFRMSWTKHPWRYNFLQGLTTIFEMQTQMMFGWPTCLHS